MNPGKMDRQIVIQARTLTADGTGGIVETWADAFTVWAELIEKSAREARTADAEKSIADRQFRIRYKANLASDTHRVFYQLKFYNITGITEEGRKNLLILSCQSVQSTT